MPTNKAMRKAAELRGDCNRCARRKAEKPYKACRICLDRHQKLKKTYHETKNGVVPANLQWLVDVGVWPL